MKKIGTILAFLILAGCSSQPKQIEPKGAVRPVYVLQDEVNERPHWRNEFEKQKAAKAAKADKK